MKHGFQRMHVYSGTPELGTTFVIPKKQTIQPKIILHFYLLFCQSTSKPYLLQKQRHHQEWQCH